MNPDQSKTNPSQDAAKAAPGSGKLVGNKDLHGKGLQKPAVEQPSKSTGSDKDSSKAVKKT